MYIFGQTVAVCHSHENSSVLQLSRLQLNLSEWSNVNE